MRRLPRTRPAAHARQAPDRRQAPGIEQTPRSRQATRFTRLSGRWLAVALIAAAIALIAPGIRYATASQPTQASLSSQVSVLSQSSATAAGCKGVTPAAFPAVGFITNAARTQGGHLWWRTSATGTGVCIGTVVEWVQYNATATKTWQVIIYSAQHPDGQAVAQRTFTLGRGRYFWDFGVHQVYAGLSAVCITATDSFGTSCLHFGPSQG